jgi:hypothetical protein
LGTGASPFLVEEKAEAYPLPQQQACHQMMNGSKTCHRWIKIKTF